MVSEQAAIDSLELPYGRVIQGELSLELHYRHVNQGEPWQQMDMKQTSDGFSAAIPSAYTDSPFPLQYYFRIRLGRGTVILNPGLEKLFNGQPYYVVRQA